MASSARSIRSPRDNVPEGASAEAGAMAMATVLPGPLRQPSR
jgi:hypothetical protein